MSIIIFIYIFSFFLNLCVNDYHFVLKPRLLLSFRPWPVAHLPFVVPWIFPYIAGLYHTPLLFLWLLWAIIHSVVSARIWHHSQLLSFYFLLCLVNDQVFLIFLTKSHRRLFLLSLTLFLLNCHSHVMPGLL